MNNVFIIVCVLLVIVAIALAALKAKGAGQESTAKLDFYYLKKSLYSPAERSFLGVLEILNYDGVTISSKVRLADIFGIKRGLERGDRQRALNRISAKHVDFLLTKRATGEPLLGIELDDSSHEAADRAARDSFVDAVFASAGLSVLHITARATYDPKEIHCQLQEALEKRS